MTDQAKAIELLRDIEHRAQRIREDTAVVGTEASFIQRVAKEAIALLAAQEQNAAPQPSVETIQTSMGQRSGLIALDRCQKNQGRLAGRSITAKDSHMSEQESKAPDIGGMLEKIAILFETFAVYGMQATFSDGKKTPNALLCESAAKECRAYALSLRAENERLVTELVNQRNRANSSDDQLVWLARWCRKQFGINNDEVIGTDGWPHKLVEVVAQAAESALREKREGEDFKPMLYEVAQELDEQLCAFLNGEQPWEAADKATNAFHKWEDENLPAAPREEG